MSASEPKRRKLSLQICLESQADGRTPVHQVFADGTFLPAVHSHFERTSAAATAFVARALAPQPAVSIETRATNTDPSNKWAASVVTDVEGAIYEVGRAISVIESLRAEKPLLELRRQVVRKQENVVSGVSAQVIKDGKSILMAKRRAMTKCADLLSDRAAALAKWVEADNIFCDSFLMLRKRCSGIRRRPDGMPLIDVADGQFLPVRRKSEQTQTDDSAGLHIVFPASTYLRFGVNTVEADYSVVTAPVVVEGNVANDQNIKALIRRIRLSRVSSFRQRTFDLFAKEAATSESMIDLSTNALSLEAGPLDIVRIEKTRHAQSVASVEIGTDPMQIPLQNIADIQLASLLQVIAEHAVFTQTLSPNQPPQLLERVISACTARTILQRTEAILDEAVRLLRVRLEWTRGPLRAEEARVRIYSTDADGDGPSRALATIEPVTDLNNALETTFNGHVRITPAFGVIIPSPDDPSARGRAIPPHSSGGSASALGLDDVPRAYICPVTGEILSALTLLLCIRLLDALELSARADIKEILDVDRQCFTVIVCCPNTGRTLKAKAWPRGPGVGKEIPSATVWLDKKKVENFPCNGPGRLAAWRGLLNRIVVDENVERGVQEGQKAVQAVTATKTTFETMR